MRRNRWKNHFEVARCFRILTPALAIVLGALAASECASGAPPTRPNILFAIADDWSYGHAGAYGCRWVKTPAFDRVARQGILFTNAYTPNTKCAPSRSCILTGHNSWQLKAAANHIPFFPPEFKSYAEALAEHGYFVGKTAKGWAPGVAEDAAGQPRQMAGQPFDKRTAKPPASGIGTSDYAGNFDDFLNAAPKDQPWCFWYGGLEPHRGYDYGSGVAKGGKKLFEQYPYADPKMRGFYERYMKGEQLRPGWVNPSDFEKPSPAASPAASSRPNIIFILADDLGYGDLGCYGQKQIRTPHLDSMAAQGMRFTDFYAGSTVCAPSRCVLMTGLHTGHAYIRGNSKNNLRPEDITVAKILRQAGYATALIGKWGLGHEGSPGVPTRQGFDYFFGYLDQTHAHNYYPSFLLRNEERVALRNVVPSEGPVGQGVASQRLEYSPDLMTSEALAFIDRNKDHPFFLYLAYTVPHANNEAKSEGMEVPDLGIYKDKDWPAPQKALAAMITLFDRDIGTLFDRLRRHGIDEHTIVFMSSDNGPHREGGNNPDFFDSNGPLRGIKRDLYEGGIRTPMIVRWPGKVAKGKVSRHVGYFADFLPTAAELAGTKAPADQDGISFLPAILGREKQQKKHPYLYWEFYEQGSAQAVRMGSWKGMIKPFGGETELYDLQSDVGEQNNVAGLHPDVVSKIRAAMKEAHVPSPLWKVPAIR